MTLTTARYDYCIVDTEIEQDMALRERLCAIERNKALRDAIAVCGGDNLDLLAKEYGTIRIHRYTTRCEVKEP